MTQSVARARGGSAPRAELNRLVTEKLLEQDLRATQLVFDSGVPLVYLPGYHVGAQLRLSLPESVDLLCATVGRETRKSSMARMSSQPSGDVPG